MSHGVELAASSLQTSQRVGGVRCARADGVVRGPPSFAQVMSLQRTVGNRATSRLLQRHGRHQGIPGSSTVAAGTYLVHGTNVERFRDRSHPAQPIQRRPDPPAWFAAASAFSAHAGGRLGGAATYFHHYEVTQPLDLIVFDDVADLSQFLVYCGHPATALNGVAEARLIEQEAPVIDGYIVDRDAVRQEREYILFASGLTKIDERMRTVMEAKYEIEGYDQLPSVGDLAKRAVTGQWRVLKGRGGRKMFELNTDPNRLDEFDVIGQQGPRQQRSFSL